MTTGLPTPINPPEFRIHPDPLVPPGSVLIGAPSDLADGSTVWALPYQCDEADGELTYTLGPGATWFGDEAADAFLETLLVTRASADSGAITTVVHRGPDGEPLLVLLTCLGTGRGQDFRAAGAALARAAKGRQRLITSVPALGDDSALIDFVAGMTLGSFALRIGQLRATDRPVAEVVLCGTEWPAGLLDGAVTRARASWRARRLASLPGAVKPPAWLADYAGEVAAETGLTAQVWDETELARDGFGGLVAVGQAAAAPPRLIRLDYAPPKATRRTPRVVLIGKGITFDSGGLSIKPADNMITMKRDMTGAGVVLSVLASLQALECPVPVTGLLAVAENAISGDALRPGDVITHFGGRTTEVTNTDAEGRLVLADALAYAAAELKPAVVLDIATLTGAMRIALGHRTGGFFATDDALAAGLLTAASRSGEAMWRMPLFADYEDKLASPIADADNAPGGPGAIMAALFLKKFTGTAPWAHIDMSSAAEAAEDRHELTRGPTGFGARLLLEWLCPTQSAPGPLAGLSG